MGSIASSARRLAGRGRRRWWPGRPAVVGGLVAFGLLLSTPCALAETTPVLALAPSIDVVLTNIRNWIMGILALLATVFLTLGGVRYLLAGGDPGELEAAKRSFKSAGYGYGLAALAPLLVEVLRGIVGA